MRLHRIAAVAAIATLAAAAVSAGIATPGGAQAIDNQVHLTVNKVVAGNQPAGTQFTIDISCSRNGDPPTSSSVVMNGPGNVAEADYLLDGPVVCTITEPATGGATASFDCSTTGNAQCNGNVVTFVNGGSTGTVTVTNTFSDPITVQGVEVAGAVATAIVAVPRTTR